MFTDAAIKLQWRFYHPEGMNIALQQGGYEIQLKIIKYICIYGKNLKPKRKYPSCLRIVDNFIYFFVLSKICVKH